MDLSYYKELILNAPFGYAYHKLVFDPEGLVVDYIFLEVNEAFEKLTGLCRQDVIGEKATEVIPYCLESHSEWLKVASEACSSGREMMREHFFEPLGRWYRVYTHPMSKDTFTVLFMDDSSQHLMQDEVLESRERFRLLSKYSVDWLLLLGKDLRVLFSSSAIKNILGIEAEEVISSRTLRFIHVEDQPKLQDFLQIVIKEPQSRHTIELRLLDSESRLHWVEAIATNLMDVPHLEAILLNIRETTAQKKAIQAANASEEQLRLIAENVSDIIFITDKNLNTTYVSPSVFHVLGETVEEHLARSLEDKHPPEAIKQMMQLLGKELKAVQFEGANPKRSRVIDTEYIKTDGSVIDISMHMSFIWGPEGEYQGLLGVSRDVSEERRMERELKESNSYIRSLLAAIPDLMFILDKDGVVLDLKAGTDRNLLVPREHGIGRALNEILPHEISDQTLVAISEILAGRDVDNIHYQLTIENELHDFEARLSPYEGNKVIAMVRDISKEQRAISALESQSRFQAILADISTDFLKSKLDNLSGLIDQGLQKVGEHFQVHRAYLFRYSEDMQELILSNEWCAEGTEPLSQRASRFSTAKIPWWNDKILKGESIIASDLERVPSEAEADFNILRSQNIQSFLCVPLATGDKVLGYLGFDSVGIKRSYPEAMVSNLKVIANVLADVIHKQQIEEAIRHLSDLQDLLSKMATHYISMPTHKLEESIDSSLADMGRFTKADRVYIFEYDHDNKISINTHEWNAEGISPQIENLQAVPWTDMQHWVDQHSDGHYVYVEDVSLLPKDNSVRRILEAQDIRSTIAIPMMQDDKCLGFVGFDSVSDVQRFSEREITLLELYSKLLVNVISRVELENSLRVEKEKAEAASKAKSEFLANMSHEIRTPLNGVIGFTELLLNSKLNDVQHSYAQNIVSSSYNLMGIINDVLDFSKIEAGKLELEYIRADIIELVEHAADIVKIKTAQKGVELLLDIAPTVPRFAVIDPLRVNQILVNLLSNAAKFTEVGEVHLSLTYKMTDGDHADITFTVRDTGIGIKRQQRKMLFRSFSQLDSSTTRKYGGTGLGLTISSHLARMMNSHIELQSEEGQGSTFSFTINARVERGEKDASGELSGIKRALVIDDNQNNLTIMQHTLEHWEISPELCNNGLNALKLVKEAEPFDVIIVDYNMPYLNGVNTIKMIQSQLPIEKSKRPIILMHSSAEDAQIMTDCLELDINHRLVKPVKHKHLWDTLLRISTNSGEALPSPNQGSPKEIETLDFAGDIRILIAEDNLLNLTLLKEMIGKQIPSAKITQATDGIQAIKAIQEYDPHIVLMDVQMPNMDGISATREIRKTSQVPIIAVTAGALKEERDKCLAIGMNAFLTKPVLATELREALQELLGDIQSAPAKQQVAKDMNMNHFNHKALMENLSQDEETLFSLLDIVQNTIPGKLKNLEQAINEDDSAEVLGILHSIRGSAQNMYFVLLGETSGKLERSYRDISKEDALALYQDIMQEWHIVLDLIKDFKLD